MKGPTRYVSRAQEHRLLRRQDFACANRPDSAVRRYLQNYVCLLWNSDRQGRFDAAGFESDHDIQWSSGLAGVNDDANRQLLCANCHRRKTQIDLEHETRLVASQQDQMEVEIVASVKSEGDSSSATTGAVESRDATPLEMQSPVIISQATETDEFRRQTALIEQLKGEIEINRVLLQQKSRQLEEGMQFVKEIAQRISLSEERKLMDVMKIALNDRWVAEQREREQLEAKAAQERQKHKPESADKDLLCAEPNSFGCDHCHQTCASK